MKVGRHCAVGSGKLSVRVRRRCQRRPFKILPASAYNYVRHCAWQKVAKTTYNAAQEMETRYAHMQCGIEHRKEVISFQSLSHDNCGGEKVFPQDGNRTYRSSKSQAG